MLEWIMMPLRRYAEFGGRSSRKEYWLFVLFCLLVFAVLGALMFAGGLTMEQVLADEPFSDISQLGPLFWASAGLLALFFLAVLLPSIALTVRRFHDRNLSGWWYVLFIVVGLLPTIGSVGDLATFVVTILPGTKGPNRFGSDPLDPLDVSAFD